MARARTRAQSTGQSSSFSPPPVSFSPIQAHPTLNPSSVVYFDCPPLCGIFFPPSKVSLLPNEPSPSPSSSLSLPHPQAHQELDQSSSTSLCSDDAPADPSSCPSLHSQSDLASHNPLPDPNHSTPRPKTRPSLPSARETASLTRKSSLSFIPNPISTTTPMLTKKQPLLRNPSTTKLPSNSSCPSNPPFDPLPLQLTSSGSTQGSHPFPNKTARNSLSSSTNQIKRASVHHLPARPSSRTSHKRAESVHGHYARTDPPQWARTSQGQRPKSRLSLAAAPESRPPHDPSPPSNSHLADLLVLQAENANLQAKILTLQDETEQNQLRSSELDEQHLLKRSELELELERLKQSLNQHEKNRLVELEKTKHELAQRSQPELNSLREEVSKLKEGLKSNQQSLAEQTSKFHRERTELQNQLHQLRSAGQSLCGVYENKISNLEELRLSQLHESQLTTEELKATKLALEELQEKARLHSTDNSTDNSASVNLAKEAIEIDNERLKADLKHAEERLSTVQDEAYQLKQALTTEHELHEQQGQLYEETLQRHVLSMKEAKEEKQKLENQKASSEFKLGQVEARLKETLETMEQERIELEGLRAELLVSSHHPHTSKSLHPMEEENNATATIVNTATGGSVHSDPMASELGSNLRQSQLESELKDKQSRIEFLEGELGRHSSLRQSRSRVQSDNHYVDSNAIMDQEKMLVIQKYQRLLLIKDEENLKLTQRLEELDDELDHSSKSKFSLLPSRGILFQQFQSSPRLKHHASAQSLRPTKSFHGSPGITPMLPTHPNKTSEEMDTAKELGKVTQQLVGLKLIARQANDERVKCDKDNQALKEVIEDLKQNNRTLEQKLVQLVEAGSSGGQTVQKIKPDITQLNRSRSFRELGIEMENALADAGDNPNKAKEQYRHHSQGGGGEVIIGDYKRVQQLEREIDELKDKLVDLQQKHSRQVDALQKEVLELEGMIEAKVFLEGKLEGEIEELKQVIEATKQAQMYASPPTPRAGAGLQRSNSKHLRRQTFSPDYQSQTTKSPSQTIPTSNQWSISRRASSLEYHRNGGSGPVRTEEVGHVGENSLNSLEEEEEEEEEKGDEGRRYLSKEQPNGFSKDSGVSNGGAVQHDPDVTSPGSDSRTRIIVTNNDGHYSTPTPPPRGSKQAQSETKHRHTIANSPLAAMAHRARSPQVAPHSSPLPRYSHHSPTPTMPAATLERCELCDGLDHQLDTCPIFSG